MAKRKDLSRMHSNMLKVRNPLKQFHGPMAAPGGEDKENKGSTGVDLPKPPKELVEKNEKYKAAQKDILEQKEKEAAEALRRKNNSVNYKPTDLDETENMNAAEIRENMLNRSFPSQRRDLK